ncbi:MAG: class I SAM-dependent RNA methyltransferase [Treponema sp.]|nr:class I SAM-dependent RNA methyltransferase [Treponema sp.]
MAAGDVYQLHLESIAPGGDAFGRYNGKTVFVEGGAPDETAVCRIVQEHKTWARAELLEITEISPVRIPGNCAFYGRCGGCNLQHIDYDAQLAAKEKILKDSFLRIGGLEPPGEIKIFPSPPWEYRNRMQFHVKSSRQKFGLKGKRSDEIITVTDCPVAVPGIKNILQGSAANGAKIEISVPPEKDRFTVFSKDDVFLNEGDQRRGKINLLGKEIIIDAGVFFQSNCFMLEKLILELQETAENAAKSFAQGAGKNLQAYDLYCGVGTFAVFLKDLFPKIICAEENKTAVSIARENLKGADAEFIALRDTEWQRIIFRQKNETGFAVADPPRAGLNPKTAAALSQNGPDVLAYVSCDPASLARDSKILTNGGYNLEKLMLFDFYPQTSHMESLAVLIR